MKTVLIMLNPDESAAFRRICNPGFKLWLKMTSRCWPLDWLYKLKLDKPDMQDIAGEAGTSS